MSMGTVFLGLVWSAFVIWGIVGGFKDIWPFGVLLVAITLTLGISNYKLKQK